MNVNHLFSNGTEYEEFLNKNCFRCKRYVNPEDASPENTVCPIEEAIMLASFGITENFPVDALEANGFMHRYDCRKKVPEV